MNHSTRNAAITTGTDDAQDVTDSPTTTALIDALGATDPSVRLRAALAAGTSGESALLGVLIERSGREPDFFVRDMLTWALTRLPTTITVPALLTELHSPSAQARSQSLHTLSKIADRPEGDQAQVWRAITPELLHDPDNEVARSAWRAAVAGVPADSRAVLAEELGAELGRRDLATRRSLSRAMVCLGAVIEGVLSAAADHPDSHIRAHAAVTAALLADPDGTVESDFESVERVLLLRERRGGDEHEHDAD